MPKAVTKKITTPVKKTIVKEISKPIVKESAKPVLAKYLNKNLKVSPRKLRLLVETIKKFPPSQALIGLQFTSSASARILRKCIEDAVASAKNNHKLISESLKFAEIRVDDGQKIKRMDKSHGSRFARGIIQKRHSRLVIILSGTIAS